MKTSELQELLDKTVSLKVECITESFITALFTQKGNTVTLIGIKVADLINSVTLLDIRRRPILEFLFEDFEVERTYTTIFSVIKEDMPVMQTRIRFKTEDQETVK